ncbi:hypothetical protein [Flexibacterium corallicola]|uniref:hypothetical protein n=1 Tax=Flexibacterium corallicola TaxID=3037259 RepID=UPI00286F6FB7|nr:hypothetical protein [Pseudovibrio sp. M1P-2-3]
MPVLFRPKINEVYETTAQWWGNQGQIQFIAHAITADGATRLAPIKAVGAGGGAGNHPDQLYWRDNSAQITAAIARLGARIIRIEIDCTLMPCTRGQNCCLYVVPQLVNQVRPNTTIRFFSHRDENMARGNENSKRYFDCQSNDGHAALERAYNANRDWCWAPYDGRHYA